LRARAGHSLTILVSACFIPRTVTSVERVR